MSTRKKKIIGGGDDFFMAGENSFQMDKKRGGRDTPGRPREQNSAGGSRSLLRAFRGFFHLGIDGREDHSAEEHHGGDHKSQFGIDGVEETGKEVSFYAQFEQRLKEVKAVLLK